jgi:hypothetical protein
MINKNIKNLKEKMDSGFGEIARKFDLLSNEISVRDREIAVMNREIAVIDRENSAIKGNIGEKIEIFEGRLDLVDKQISAIKILKFM